MSNYRTTYHRDGTVTVWDVYQQQWRRMNASNRSDAVPHLVAAAKKALTDDDHAALRGDRP